MILFFNCLLFKLLLLFKWDYDLNNDKLLLIKELNNINAFPQPWISLNSQKEPKQRITFKDANTCSQRAEKHKLKAITINKIIKSIDIWAQVLKLTSQRMSKENIVRLRIIQVSQEKQIKCRLITT